VPPAVKTSTRTLSAEEIRDVNTRYHDVAAEDYDCKWGIEFGEVGGKQVAAKLRKALGSVPGRYACSLEIGAGTGYFTLNMLRSGLIGEATCSDISPGMLSTLKGNARFPTRASIWCSATRCCTISRT
jgi:ubiquinone/menaquinone biosynthesis C-methylase UbiE